MVRPLPVRERDHNPLDLLNVGAGNLICPGEMLGVDQHPDKTEQERKNGNQISESAQTCAFWIQRRVFGCRNDEAAKFHARRLAGSQHEQEEVDRYQSEVAYPIYSQNAAVQREILRPFKICRDDKNRKDRGGDRKVNESCGNTRRQQLTLVLGQRERRSVFRSFEVQLRLRFLD